MAAIIAAVLGSLWLIMVRDRAKARALPTRLELLVAQTGFVHRPIDREGTVQVASELWSARSVGGPIAEGTEVRVVEVEGLSTIVEPVSEAAAASDGVPPTPPAPLPPSDVPPIADLPPSER